MIWVEKTAYYCKVLLQSPYKYNTYWSEGELTSHTNYLHFMGWSWGIYNWICISDNHTAPSYKQDLIIINRDLRLIPLRQWHCCVLVDNKAHCCIGYYSSHVWCIHNIIIIGTRMANSHLRLVACITTDQFNLTRLHNCFLYSCLYPSSETGASLGGVVEEEWWSRLDPSKHHNSGKHTSHCLNGLCLNCIQWCSCYVKGVVSPAMCYKYNISNTNKSLITKSFCLLCINGNVMDDILTNVRLECYFYAPYYKRTGENCWLHGIRKHILMEA